MRLDFHEYPLHQKVSTFNLEHFDTKIVSLAQFYTELC